MKKVLICWIGHADLNAVSKSEAVGLGPIAQAVKSNKYDHVALISNLSDVKVKSYIKWLKSKVPTDVILYKEKISGPTSFGEIYESAVRVVTKLQKRFGIDIGFTFHLSPGTPAMAAVWIILSKTRFPADLIESSPQYGVQTVSVPFDISADFIPDLLRRPDDRLQYLSAGLPPEAPEFDNIIHRSPVMKRVIAKARRVAPRSVPVLIEGESGTGKELIARAIHKASPRRDNLFVAVNCGAIPKELAESEFYGHEKGAFTGAITSRKGYFEAANEGTLFLDEIAELPHSMQVKLLRALQEGEISRVGSPNQIKVNVRIIAATNKNLTEKIVSGHFREDLFYRLAVAVIKLPPLRDRAGDISLLIKHLLEQVNNESTEEPGYVYKKISASAKNILLSHYWSGNVRELLNTLRQAAIWSDGSTIRSENIKEGLINVNSSKDLEILNRPLGDGFNVQNLISKVTKHYVIRALNETKGNKSKAAKILGLPSYQTLTNWMNKYEIDI